MKKPPKAPKPWKGWVVIHTDGARAFTYTQKPRLSPFCLSRRCRVFRAIGVRPTPAKRRKAVKRG